MLNFKNITQTLVALSTGLSLAGSACAEGAIFKQVGPDGRVVYTDKPDSKLKTEKKIQPEYQPSRLTSSGVSIFYTPGAPGSPLAALPPLPGSAVVGSPVSTPGSPATGQPEKSSAKTRSDRIDAAQAEVDAAMQAADNGKTPKGGERNANVNGSSRLNSAYGERQDKLKANLDAAREKLDKAFANN